MSNIESSGNQLPNNEVLDPTVYARLLTDFSRTVLHPKLSEVLTWREAEAGWPGFDPIDARGGSEDFSVGRKREVTIVSGPEKAELTLYVWDSNITRELVPDPESGFPVGSLFIQTDDRSYNEERPGALIGLVDLYQLPVVHYDFAHGTQPAPAEEPQRGAALVRIANYLGLDPKMVTEDLTGERGEDSLIGSVATNAALERLADGMSRLRQDAADTNQVII